ncbi:MAG TPA: hypothetical protein VJX16_25930 [Terriglobales bacterium]|nr:hypothetical protein [Terriglobales bacterium]
MAPLNPIIDSLSSFWRRGTRAERAGYVVGALLMISGFTHLVILLASGGSWEGPLSLRKPATFGFSFGLTLITIVWVASFLDLGRRGRTILLTVFTAACTLETALVSLQAWRGVPSHFNTETAGDALVARALAVGGAALVIVIFVWTTSSFRTNTKVPMSLLIAIRTGFVALLSAQVIGGLMIARGMALVFRGNPQAAYATGGMLKPTHAVAMHGILVLPALAWLLSFTDWSERRRMALVVAATVGYLLVVGMVAMANVTGVSPQRLPLPMAAILTLGAVSLVVAAGVTLVGVTRAPTVNGIQHS